MNRAIVFPGVLSLSVLVSSFFVTPVAQASDCADKTLTTKTTTLGYSSSYENPSNKAGIESRLKMMVSMMNKEQVMKAQNAILTLQDTVDKTHPQYWVFDMITMLMDTKLEKLNETKSIAETAMGVESLSILVEVVQALDLVDTLNGEGNFTVFAPTNQAFEALLAQLDMTFEELAQNTELLKTVVLYHVLDTAVVSTDILSLQEGTLVTTLGGETVRTSSRDGVKVDNANVIQADIQTSNGVVHVIDSVLLPPSVLESLELPIDRGTSDIATVAIESGLFPTLVAALEAADLVGALQAEGPFTVYAPTEEAFAKLLTALDITAAELLNNKELLTSVLTYHVVPGFYDASDVLSIDGSIESATLNGKSLTISNGSQGPTVNDIKIIQTDIYGSNGVVHVIDEVLLP